MGLTVQSLIELRIAGNDKPISLDSKEPVHLRVISLGVEIVQFVQEKKRKSREWRNKSGRTGSVRADESVQS